MFSDVYTRRKRKRQSPKRRWRDYRTASGRRPVKEFLDGLSDRDAAEVVAVMDEVVKRGIRTAKHVENDLYQIVADGERETFRILFAQEGAHDQVLLSLEGFSKKQQKTPRDKIELAKRRLHDWRARGRAAGKA